MKRIIFTTVIIFNLALQVLQASAEPDTLYSSGIRHYSEGRYDLALETWLGLVDSGYASADLHYNIGNAAFKTGKIPESILYYEKALLERPFDEDIRYNLEIARTFVLDRFETIPQLFIVRWFGMISLLFSSNFWAIASLILFTLALVLILIYLFSLKLALKKFSFYSAIIILAISMLSLALSYQNRSITVKKRDAIIFSPAVTGKSSPDISGKDLFIIHEGTRVEIEDEVGGWYEIRLSDGNVGWIQVSDAEKI